PARLRRLLSQAREPAAGHVLEALLELLLGLHQRGTREDQDRVLVSQAGRDFDVILIRQTRLDRHRHDLPGAAREHDVAVPLTAPRAPGRIATTARPLRPADDLGKEGT